MQPKRHFVRYLGLIINRFIAKLTDICEASFNFPSSRLTTHGENFHSYEGESLGQLARLEF